MAQWGEIYRRFATLRPDKGVDRKVLAYLNALDPGQPVLVACSGGADSVYLLLTLLTVFEGDRSRVRVVHFNHGLRGAESDADAAFVEELAESLEVSFEGGRPKNPLNADEASLREARYAWFSAVYRRSNAGAVVLGHHGDDLLESLLMGILSGSGPAGLASPMPVREFPDGQVRLRPLLGLRREEIEKTLRGMGIPWREDSSNANTDYTRNWLRNEILPALHERIPQDIHAAGYRTRELMEEAVAALDAHLRECELDISNPESLNVQALLGKSRGLARRALTGWWLRHYPDAVLRKASADQVVELIHLGKTENPVSIGRLSETGEPQTLQLDLHGRLILSPEKAPRTPPWKDVFIWDWNSGELDLPNGAQLGGSQLSWEPQDTPYLQANPAVEAWVSGIEPPLRVRQWQPGDKYEPLGAPGRRKLQDLFMDAKLDAEQKHELPVILNKGNEIIWVPGFPPANDFKISPESNSALKLTYRRHSPPFPLHYGG